LVQAWDDTAWSADLLVCVDDDDPELSNYGKIGCNLHIAPRLRLGGTLNHIAVANMLAYDNLGFMGDDHLPKTEEWDTRVQGALCNSMIVYGNDLLQGANLPTAVFMRAEIVRALGYMVPPGMIHLYLDNFWKLLGESLGSIQYLPDVIIEHLHPSCGKADNDAQYQEVNAPELYSHDGALFSEYVQKQLALDVAKIRGE